MSVLATLPVVQFVVGLREGVEAALVVGIVATFLHQSGHSDALRWMWAGVALAIGVCLAVAAVLEVVDQNLPQRRQEGFEAIVGLVAVASSSSPISASAGPIVRPCWYVSKTRGSM